MSGCLRPSGFRSWRSGPHRGVDYWVRRDARRTAVRIWRTVASRTPGRVESGCCTFSESPVRARGWRRRRTMKYAWWRISAVGIISFPLLSFLISLKTRRGIIVALPARWVISLRAPSCKWWLIQVHRAAVPMFSEGLLSVVWRIIRPGMRPRTRASRV